MIIYYMLMSRRTNILTNTDWLTVILYLLLVFFGWLNIFSVNYYDQQYTGIFDFDHRYGMQLIWIFIGFILAVFVTWPDHSFIGCCIDNWQSGARCPFVDYHWGV